MKRSYIILMLVTLVSLTFGEDNINNGFEPSTLLDNKEMSFGGYGAPIFQGMYMNNQFYYAAGGEGGLILNHQYIIGGAGKGVTTPIYTTNNSRLFMGWGGLMLGYVYAPEALVHPYIKTVIGAGGIGEVTNISYRDQ